MSGRRGVKQSRYRLLNGALFLLLSLKYTFADGNVGCLYNNQLCDEETEWCYDDFAFGRCVFKGLFISDNLYKYKFEYEDLEKLKDELEELKKLGFTWKHAYTQCNIQTQLYAIKFGLPYKGEMCEQIFKKDISDPIRLLQYQQHDISRPPRINSRHGSVFPANEGIVKYEPDEEVKSPSLVAGDSYERQPSDYENELINQLRLQTKNKKGKVYKKSAKSTSSRYRGTPLYLPQQNRQFTDNEDKHMDYNEKYEDEDDWNQLNENNIYNDILSLQKALDMLNSRKENRGYAEGGAIDLSDKKTDYKNIMYDEIFDQDLFGFERSERLDVKKPGPHFKVNNYAFGNIKAEEENSENSEEINDGNDFEKKISPRNVNTGKQFQEQKLEYEYVPNYGHLSYITIEANNNLTQPSVQSFIGTLRNKYRWPPEVFKKSNVYAGNTLVLTVAPNIFQFSANDIKDKIEEYYSTNKIAGIDIKKIYVGKPDVLLRISGISDSEQHLIDSNYAYIQLKGVQNNKISKWKYADEIVESVISLLNLPKGAIKDVKPAAASGILFRVSPDVHDLTVENVAEEINSRKDEINKRLQIDIQSAGIYQKDSFPHAVHMEPDNVLYKLTFVVCGVMAAVLVSTIALYFVKKQSKSKNNLYEGSRDKGIVKELCQDSFRKRMSGKSNPDSAAAGQRVAGLSRESDNSPSSRSSTSSWSEEPMTNMDITTGHMVLAYMEDHLRNKARLDTEWAALCAYDAEPCSVTIAQQQENMRKNRYVNALPYDHARLILNALSNLNGSDYVNASTITDHDPRNAAYIATQGPLENTTCDFWQMIWEQGCVVIVMLTRLIENDTSMCYRYWPLEGAKLYNIYEVHLVSEHIWCDDFLVRSFYLKNLKTTETRTVTQFHFLTWPEGGIPPATKPLLEFRRKVNKSFRGRSCPIVVHCSDGVGRTGSYLLLDMVLNRISKGAREIDIAATLEHIRDQRAGAVCTKQQFQFVLSAVAEEVQAVLKALPQQQQSIQDQNVDNVVVAPLVQVLDETTSQPQQKPSNEETIKIDNVASNKATSEQPRKPSK